MFTESHFWQRQVFIFKQKIIKGKVENFVKMDPR